MVGNLIKIQITGNITKFEKIPKKSVKIVKMVEKTIRIQKMGLEVIKLEKTVRKNLKN